MARRCQDHDACGVGFIAQLSGGPRRDVIDRTLLALQRLSHRGGVDADGCSGDGAGLLTELPKEFFVQEARRLGIALPARWGLGMAFLPPHEETNARQAITHGLAATHVELLGWREVPIEPRHLGPRSAMTLPLILQFFVAPRHPDTDFERQLFLARKRVESMLPEDAYLCSLSERTVVYKGLLVPWQLPAFYPDLADSGFASRFAVFHQRYSTNTSPTWRLAQPFRMVGHNGEINTIGSNRRWLRARTRSLRREFHAGEWFQPLEENVSDSASLDNALELLIRQGYSAAAAMYRIAPPAWEHDQTLPPGLRTYLEAEARDQEPWDGPAAVIFTDGRQVGARLDRNGLRPLRYTVTEEGLVIAASEVGVAGFDNLHVIERSRLGPGEMILADPEAGTFYHPHQVPALLGLGNEQTAFIPMPHIGVDDLAAAGAEAHETAQDRPAAHAAARRPSHELLQHASGFGFTQDQFKLLFKSAAESGKEAIFSMGDDAPPAFLSSQQRLLWDYCKQRFAQVTNPPIDSLREAHVMSLDVYLGGAPVVLSTPLLDEKQLEQIETRGQKSPSRIDITFEAAGGVAAAREALQRIRREAAGFATTHTGYLLLTDRAAGPERAAVPALLAISAAFKALVAAEAWRTPLVIETGQVWDTHHVAMSIACGASAVLPYLAWELAEVAAPGSGVINLRHAIESGLRKVLAKMGISTIASYRNSHLFETVGLDAEVVEEFFEDAVAHLAGASLDQLLQEAIERQQAAFARTHASSLAGDNVVDFNMLRDAGLYRFRRDGELHSTSPDLVRRFHAFVKEPTQQKYREYTAYLAERPAVSVRDLLTIKTAATPPAGEVEPVRSLVQRFSTQAMSLGAISREAQHALAVAMNRLGGRSNTGEGGEDRDNYSVHPEANNRIKQVASARFGVTAEYLIHAAEIEIKMAQGAKPGEGGQLPPLKVTPYIARLRHAVPGMALISPPPHHDIYSIEDLAQLIHDLKAINPTARIAVKLVSGGGVGIIAAGVAKAGADVITIAGHDGGTGASPLTSIKNTGLPWEVGLRDAHTTLVRCGFRSRVRLRVDGGFKSGRDVLIAALMGADEFGFGTAALVAVGCVMVRQCHLNTCPTGIATQDERLRQKFAGTPEMLVAFFEAVAGEVREGLSKLGARSLDEIIGRVDRLEAKDPQAAARLGDLLDPLPEVKHPLGVVFSERPTLQQRLLELLDKAERTGHIHSSLPVTSGDRSVGARLSGEVLRRFGVDKLAPGTFEYEFHGAAGQSFGAFLVEGIRFTLKGEANDYVGKGLSGGDVTICDGVEASRRGDVLAGNTVLYGATSGRLFIAGRAGERFAVRNSGALAVVEGVGQHGCEYMTAGLVAILGPTGANFGSGMTGGLAYIPRESLSQFRCHQEYVRVEAISAWEEHHLRALLELHYERTASWRAGKLLAAAGLLGLVRVQPMQLPCPIEQTWANVWETANGSERVAVSY